MTRPGIDVERLVAQEIRRRERRYGQAAVTQSGDGTDVHLLAFARTVLRAAARIAEHGKSQHDRGPLCNVRACLDCAFNDGVSFATQAIRHAARTRKEK